MIRTCFVVAPLFAITATFLAAPLSAKEPMTVTGEPVFQESVSYADLDLRRSSGRQTLRVRVRHAADRLCVQSEGPLEEQFEGNSAVHWWAPTCATLTYRNAEPRIAAAIQRANNGQYAAAMSVIVARPAPAR